MLENAKNIFGYIYKILTKKQKLYGISVLFVSVVGAFLEMLGVSVIAPMVMALMDREKLMNNSLLAKVADFLVLDGYKEMVLFICIAVIVVYILKNIFFIFLSWYRAKYSCKVLRELSVEMMASYMKQGYPFFLNTNTGSLINGVTSDVGNVYLIVSGSLKILAELMTIFFIVLYMCMTDIGLAVGVILLAFVCLSVIYIVFRKKMVECGERYREYSGKSHQALLHAFEGIKDVVILNKREFFVEEYNHNYGELQNANVERTVGGEIPAYIIETVCVSGLLMLVYFQATMMEDPTAMIATLSTFAIGAFRILPSLGRMSSYINSITSATPSMRAVYENIMETRRISDGQDNNEKIAKEKLEYNKLLELKNITFMYPNKDLPVLAKLNIAIVKGQSIAFIGKSGAGKTTLADIILGLLKPQNGKILLDGIEVDSSGTEWSRLVGYVPQSIYLSDKSIRCNVAFGIDEKEIDDALVWNTLEQAQLMDFVKGLPEGLDTFVGDRGVRFSGGQKQRIAIARALYHNPQILVLDEATAALDNETEEAVMKAIEALKGKITTVIVAHRLTTVKNCDIIYEIKNGKAIVRKIVSYLEIKLK